MRADELLKRHSAVISTSRRAPISGWGIECGPGWHEIIDDALTEISKIGRYQVVQIKEKSGRLRIYMTRYDDTIHEIVERAERRSLLTCEVCGRPGQLRQCGAAMVRCDEHVSR
ncbi:hypothetical protein RISW2_22980 [Roseivivax isoporae LMG 25204]|uniref:Uncharacterized protein n=1 Tax=Roseivivax isoporae LMG 25204 TaxID=1449351 RepID=X7F381_9RHOB|nr:hypothetical protein RISW2_22980 [Roseivivax isoporae LMG 25204]